MTEILNHVEAGVMTLTLNRLERKNSITSAMYAALVDGLAQAANIVEQAIATRQPVPRA